MILFMIMLKKKKKVKKIGFIYYKKYFLYFDI